MIITQTLKNAINELVGFSIDNSHLNFKDNDTEGYQLKLQVSNLRNKLQTILYKIEKLESKQGD